MTRNPQSEVAKPEPSHYIAYGWPPVMSDGPIDLRTDDFELQSAESLSDDSFLDFDGAVIFAGVTDEWTHDGRVVPCKYRPSPAEIDRRERETFSLIGASKLVLFLTANVPVADDDLFSRVTRHLGVKWARLQKPFPRCEARALEFAEYVKRFGSGYVQFEQGGNSSVHPLTPLIMGSDLLFGWQRGGNLFFLPCRLPAYVEELLNAASIAISAIQAYRRRTSNELPEWASTFEFARESQLRTQLTDLQRQVVKLQTSITPYVAAKGVLCLQSDPLVVVVKDILERFLAVRLTIDEKNIEDAQLLDDQDKILAVFEIKGVKGNFGRKDVNQVDSHRERLGLSAATPGVLIMNTMMSATSLDQKEEAPHPDIVKKAVVDNVLIMRTLDLIRYADAAERGVIQKSEFRDLLLSQAGWLRIVNDRCEIVRG